MGELSSNLRSLGYEITEKESPFVEEGGRLWTKGHELVCDETGRVIRKGDNDTTFLHERDNSRVFRYDNSENVKLIGGYSGSYEWGEDDDGRFFY
jgi:hypothetical protein